MSKTSRYATRQCFYRDEKSEERHTGVVKRKYKLAGLQSHDSFKQLGIRSYIYFVTTSKNWHSHTTTLKIEPHEIMHYVHKPLRFTTTYVDLKSRERIFEDDLDSKIADPTNGFQKVGKLTNDKWGELQNMATSILGQSVGNEVKRDVLFGLLEEDVANDLLRRWGIA